MSDELSLGQKWIRDNPSFKGQKVSALMFMHFQNYAELKIKMMNADFQNKLVDLRRDLQEGKDGKSKASV